MPSLYDLFAENEQQKLGREMSYQPFSSPIPQGVVDYARDVGGRIANPANTLRSVIDRMKSQPADEMAMDWANPVAGMAGIFAGKGAKTANLAMLAKAEELAKSGVPDDAIWKQTGWTLNTPDKMPRFEIPDNKSFYRGSKAAGSSYADEVMLHPELYKEYPSAGTIKMIESPDNIGGSYSDIGREQITLGQKDASSTALHELQHAIQQREGFARGGSLDNSYITRNINELTPLVNPNKIIQRGAKSETNGPILVVSEEGKLMVTDGNHRLAAAIQRGDKTIDTHYDPSFFDGYKGNMDAAVKDAANENYKRLAGEAEARLTEARMAMTPEERLAQYPYQPDYFQKATGVPLSDLIVRMDGGKAMSIPEQGIPQLMSEAEQAMLRYELSKMPKNPQVRLRDLAIGAGSFGGGLAGGYYGAGMAE